jgi:hypothetical protein
MGDPIAHVIVAARDEAGVVGGLLADLAADPRRGELMVTVVCNGSSDATATVAGGFDRTAVLELAEPGKAAALNAGVASSPVRPVVVIDADVRLSPGAVSRTVEALEAGAPRVTAAAPAIRLVAPPGASWAVRRLVAVWARDPYHGPGLVGAGLYALAGPAVARVFPMPSVAADDWLVRRLVPAGERITVSGPTFAPEVPATWRGVVRAEARRHRARREADALLGPCPRSSRRWLLTAARAEGPAAVAVFAGTRALSRLLARRGRQGPAWRPFRRV